MTASGIDSGARAQAVARCLSILLEAAQRRRQRVAEQEQGDNEQSGEQDHD